jgi:hypothetical protein
MAELKLALLVGAESKQWLADATALVNRFEELVEKANGKRTSKSTEGKSKAVEAESEEDDSEDFEETSKKGTAKSGKKKVQKAKDFDDDDDSEDDDSDSAGDEEDSDDAEPEASEEDSDDDAESEPVKKKGKAKKLTSEDVNAACKERVKREIEDNGSSAKDARAVVSGILKKKFKVSSVTDLDEDQFTAVIKAMKSA